jgi:DNA polymerase-3 subunit alpha
MLYQEQVQFAANSLAGFSLGQGDILRRAMGKKIKEEMVSQRKHFVDGCKNTNNIPAKVAEKIFDNIEHFAGYGFNKSHSAAYAILSYQTAYLKAHYPAEFMAAVCSCDMNNADKLPVFLAESKEMGLNVYPPNVNKSMVRFRPETDGIRFGMAGIKNVGVGAVEAIIAERDANGPFEGLVDFCVRMGGQSVNKKVLESLVQCGAFDFTKMSRARLYNGIEFALQRAAEQIQDRASGQTSLFALMDATDDAADGVANNTLPECDPWPESEMLKVEKELLGFYVSGHPLMTFGWELKQFNLAGDDLTALTPASMTRVGGLVTQLQKRVTKTKKEPYAFFQLETLSGTMEVVAFPQVYRDYSVHLEENAPVFVCGQMDREEPLKLRASEIYPMKEVAKTFTDELRVKMDLEQVDEAHLGALRQQLERHPGETPVTVCIAYPQGNRVDVATDHRLKVHVDQALVDELNTLVGAQRVFVRVSKRACKRKPERKSFGQNGFARNTNGRNGHG